MEPLRGYGRSWNEGRGIASLAPSQESQAQPEPKAVLPASANLVLKVSKLPKSLLICHRTQSKPATHTRKTTKLKPFKIPTQFQPIENLSQSRS